MLMDDPMSGDQNHGEKDMEVVRAVTLPPANESDHFTEMAPHSHNTANTVAKMAEVPSPDDFLQSDYTQTDPGGSSVVRNTSETMRNSRYTRSLGFEANTRPVQNTVLYTTTSDDWKIGSSTPDERRKHQTASDCGARPVEQESDRKDTFRSGEVSVVSISSQTR
jgi:hypothetical protein